MDDGTKVKRVLTPSQYEAYTFKDTLARTWKPLTDVWSLRFGDDILGCLCFFGGISITFLFRKALKIRPHARITCYLPVAGISAMSTYMFQSYIISTDIIRRNICPLCVVTKATLGQVTIGLGYTLLSASVVCFYAADKLLTYPVPPLVMAPREVFALFQKIVSKTPRPFLVIGAMHMIAASIITFQKQSSVMYIEKQMKEDRMH